MQQINIKPKAILLFFSFYLCALFFIGCNDGAGPGIPELHDNTTDATLGDISGTLVARIYFDATLSMQGFVVPSSTRYKEIPQHLESAILSGWHDGKTEFFRFGEQVELLDGRTYLDVGSPDFYEDRNINRETFIQEIMNHENRVFENKTEAPKDPEDPTNSPEPVVPTESVNESSTEKRLVVIVTDLFQDKSDINLLVTQLKEKYIKKGLQVGLFGLRSEFDGTVYDTGLGEAPIPYRSNPNDSKTLRPFYLLVLGRHADIAHYFDRLKVNWFSDAQTIIFSPHLVNPLLSFQGASINEKRNLNSVVLDRESPVKQQYSIVRSSEPAEISATLAYKPLPHAMSFDDSETFEISISAKHDSDGGTETSEKAQKCMEVTTGFSENQLTVTFKLASSDLPRNRAIYLYEVTLSPRLDTYQVPQWCSDWDMGRERDGAKTLNLVNFVRDLSQVTARTHHPRIAQFHYYIEKR